MLWWGWALCGSRAALSFVPASVPRAAWRGLVVWRSHWRCHWLSFCSVGGRGASSGLWGLRCAVVGTPLPLGCLTRWDGTLPNSYGALALQPLRRVNGWGLWGSFSSSALTGLTAVGCVGVWLLGWPGSRLQFIFTYLTKMVNLLCLSVSLLFILNGLFH